MKNYTFKVFPVQDQPGLEHPEAADKAVAAPPELSCPPTIPCPLPAGEELTPCSPPLPGPFMEPEAVPCPPVGTDPLPCPPGGALPVPPCPSPCPPVGPLPCPPMGPGATPFGGMGPGMMPCPPMGPGAMPCPPSGPGAVPFGGMGPMFPYPSMPPLLPPMMPCPPSAPGNFGMGSPQCPATMVPPFTCPYFRLAHAYVPWQYFNVVYCPAEALNKGTLFPELYMPQGQYGPCEGPKPCRLAFGGGVPCGN